MRFWEGSGVVARGVERSETTRATTGDGPNTGYLLEPSRFVGSNHILPVPPRPARALGHRAQRRSRMALFSANAGLSLTVERTVA